MFSILRKSADLQDQALASNYVDQSLKFGLGGAGGGLFGVVGVAKQFKEKLKTKVTEAKEEKERTQKQKMQEQEDAEEVARKKVTIFKSSWLQSYDI